MKSRLRWGVLGWVIWSLSGCLADGLRATESGLVESRLLMRGTVDISGDGRLLGWSIPHFETASKAVREEVEQAIAGWRFKPLPGDIKKGRWFMALWLAGPKAGSEPRPAGLAGVSFSRIGLADIFQSGQAGPSFAYPHRMIRDQVEGRVKVLVEIGPTGRVLHADAVQVNLFRQAATFEMRRWRRLFARAAVDGLRHYRFASLLQVGQADSEKVLLVVPVDFFLDRDGAARASQECQKPYGIWLSYIPGPMAKPAWVPAALINEMGVAIEPDVPRVIDLRVRLLDPPRGLAGMDFPDG